MVQNIQSTPTDKRNPIKWPLPLLGSRGWLFGQGLTSACTWLYLTLSFLAVVQGAHGYLSNTVRDQVIITNYNKLSFELVSWSCANNGEL